jgi:ketosteroid isomerase-like protein
MSREELERVDDQGIAAINSHDADAFLGLFADEFVWQDWTVPEPIRDRVGALQYFNAWMTAFPDFQEKQTHRIVGEDEVAVEVEFTGTNTGPMVMGGNEIPPTNRTVTGRGTYSARIRDGKIVEYRTHPDAAGMMMQLGLMPQG